MTNPPKHAWRSACIAMSLATTLISAQDEPTFAVLDLDAFGVSSSEALVLTNRLRSTLVQLQVFRIIERGQMQQVLAEQDFQLAGCTSDECAVEVGQLLGVQLMLAGSVGKIGSLYTLDLRIIDVQTAKLLETITHDTQGSIDALLTEGIPEASRAIARLELAGKEKLASNMGKLSVLTKPTGATVFIEGEEIGSTPLFSHILKTGEYSMSLVHAGYVPVATSVTISSDQETNMDVSLKALPSAISIISEPPGATVRITSRRLGYARDAITPLLALDLRAGRYQIKLNHTDYSPIDTTIIAKPGDTLQFNAHFKGLPGLVSIITDPTKADITIDNVKIGQSPRYKYRLAAGRHDVRLEKAGFYLIDTSVVIISKRITQNRFVLKPYVGILILKGDPAENARVLLNGRWFGRTPITDQDLNVGKYTVFVSKPKYVPYQAKFTIHKDIITEINYSLKKKSRISATFLSAVIPGSGQLYMGYPLRGVLIMAGAIGIAYQASLQHSALAESRDSYEQHLDLYLNSVDPNIIAQERDLVTENFNAMHEYQEQLDRSVGLFAGLWLFNMIEISF